MDHRCTAPMIPRIAVVIWAFFGMVLAELINLDSCPDLIEGVRMIETKPRPLTAIDKATLAKLREWLVRAKCNIRQE